MKHYLVIKKDELTTSTINRDLEIQGIEEDELLEFIKDDELETDRIIEVLKENNVYITTKQPTVKDTNPLGVIHIKNIKDDGLKNDLFLVEVEDIEQEMLLPVKDLLFIMSMKKSDEKKIIPITKRKNKYYLTMLKNQFNLCIEGALRGNDINLSHYPTTGDIIKFQKGFRAIIDNGNIDQINDMKQWVKSIGKIISIEISQNELRKILGLETVTWIDSDNEQYIGIEIKSDIVNYLTTIQIIPDDLTDIMYKVS